MVTTSGAASDGSHRSAGRVGGGGARSFVRMARWMTDRGAMLAPWSHATGETEGVLVLPRGQRREAPTLEEVRALRRVADRLAALCHARGTRSRSSRETRRGSRAPSGRKSEWNASATCARSTSGATRSPRLGWPARTVGVYSAASRMALEALERRTSVGAPLAVVSPSGVDPVAVLARAHLAGLAPWAARARRRDRRTRARPGALEDRASRARARRSPACCAAGRRRPPGGTSSIPWRALGPKNAPRGSAGAARLFSSR